MSTTIIPSDALNTWGERVAALILAESVELQTDSEFQAWAAEQIEAGPWDMSDCTWKALRARVQEIPDLPDRPEWVQEETFTMVHSTVDVYQYGTPTELPGLTVRMARVVELELGGAEPVVTVMGPYVDATPVSAHSLPGTVGDWIADANADNLDELAAALTDAAAALRDHDAERAEN